jgi:hypothetical protein
MTVVGLLGTGNGRMELAANRGRSDASHRVNVGFVTVVASRRASLTQLLAGASVGGGTVVVLLQTERAVAPLTGLTGIRLAGDGGGFGGVTVGTGHGPRVANVTLRNGVGVGRGEAGTVAGGGHAVEEGPLEDFLTVLLTIVRTLGHTVRGDGSVTQVTSEG